jgi:hypothetical protein
MVMWQHVGLVIPVAHHHLIQKSTAMREHCTGALLVVFSAVAVYCHGRPAWCVLRGLGGT